MICPRCSQDHSRVLDSRSGTGIPRRRRQCLSCYHRWSTVEIPTNPSPDFAHVSPSLIILSRDRFNLALSALTSLTSPSRTPPPADQL